MLKGGCFCGRVRYVAGGTPYHATICHCADCRRATGSPMVGWFTVKRTDLDFVQEQPRFFASSPGVIRSFCTNCGTSLTYRRQALEEVDVTICSLDDPNLLPPNDHTHTNGRLGWVRLNDHLPQHKGKRNLGDH